MRPPRRRSRSSSPSVTGTGNYLSEVDVESERAAWTQSQLQNSMSLSILEPVLFPSTVQAIPDPNLEGKNVAIVVSGSIGTVTGEDTIPLPLTAALPSKRPSTWRQRSPRTSRSTTPARTTRLVQVSPTDPSFNPVELTINLQKGISLENTGVVDATAGQNIYLDSGQDVAKPGRTLTDHARPGDRPEAASRAGIRTAWCASSAWRAL